MRASIRAVWIIVVGAALSNGQTQIDLRTQTKSVDFSAAQSTKPFTTGTILPSGCSVGQMFFLTGAPDGQNSFGCTASGTWTLESGAGPSPTVVKNAGIAVGTRSVLDLSTGAGLLWSVSDTGQEISVQAMLDTSLAQTRAGEQSGSALFCNSVADPSSPADYSCSLAPTLRTYSTGMILHWKPNVDGSGGATTLNVDLLGARPVEGPDGTTDPVGGEILNGRLYQLWYDGNVFRLMGEVTVTTSGGTGGGATGPIGPAGPAGPVGPVGPVGPAGLPGSGSSATLAAGAYYFPFGFPVDAGSTSSPQANVVKVSMFVPANDMAVASTTYYVSGFSGCPCGLAAAIYTESGDLVGQQATAVSASGALHLLFDSPHLLTAGKIYYFAWAVDNTNTSLHAAGGGSWLFQILLNLDGTVRSGIAANPATGTGASMAMPSTLGALTSDSGFLGIAPSVAFLM